MSKEVIMNYTQQLNENSEQWKQFKKTMDDHFRLMVQQNSYIQTSKENYEKEIQQLKASLKQTTTTVHDLSVELESMREKNRILTDELGAMKKISIYSNLNKQIFEQTKYIEVLEKRLSVLSPKKIEPVVLQKEVVEEEDEEITEDSNNEEPDTEESNEDCYTDAEEQEESGDVDGDGENHEEVAEEQEDQNETEEVAEEAAEEEEESNEVVQYVEEDENNEEAAEEASEEESAEDEEEEDADEEEPEIEYETRKIGKKYYYVSNEEPAGIYTVVKETSEVGDKVGEYDENNKPVFYK
jgi:hypothetical protein